MRNAGRLLLALLGLYVAFTISVNGLFRPAPEVPGVKGDFYDSLKVSPKEAKRVFEFAKEKMTECNTKGNLFYLFASICKWLSMAATAIITIVVGYINTRKRENTALQESKRPGRGRRNLNIVIGLMSIGATLLTVLGFEAIEESETYYSKADNMLATIHSSRDDIETAATLSNALKVLEKLEAEAQRK